MAAPKHCVTVFYKFENRTGYHTVYVESWRKDAAFIAKVHDEVAEELWDRDIIARYQQVSLQVHILNVLTLERSDGKV